MKIKLLMILFMVVVCVNQPYLSDYKDYKHEEQEITIIESVEPPTMPNETVEEQDQESVVVEEVVENETLIGSSVFGYEDALMLHKISVAEAGNQSIECMALIMLVVLNRVESDKFPDTIENVIFQKTKGVAQFSPTIDGGFDKAQPNEKSCQAMELVLNNWDESQDALYFESCKGESWHSRNLKFLFEKGKMKFYKEF